MTTVNSSKLCVCRILDKGRQRLTVESVDRLWRYNSTTERYDEQCNVEFLRKYLKQKKSCTLRVMTGSRDGKDVLTRAIVLAICDNAAQGKAFISRLSMGARSKRVITVKAAGYTPEQVLRSRIRRKPNRKTNSEMERSSAIKKKKTLTEIKMLTREKVADSIFQTLLGIHGEQDDKNNQSSNKNVHTVEGSPSDTPTAIDTNNSEKTVNSDGANNEGARMSKVIEGDNLTIEEENNCVYNGSENTNKQDVHNLIEVLEDEVSPIASTSREVHNDESAQKVSLLSGASNHESQLASWQGISVETEDGVPLLMGSFNVDGKSPSVEMLAIAEDSETITSMPKASFPIDTFDDVEESLSVETPYTAEVFEIMTSTPQSTQASPQASRSSSSQPDSLLDEVRMMGTICEKKKPQIKEDETIPSLNHLDGLLAMNRSEKNKRKPERSICSTQKNTERVWKKTAMRGGGKKVPAAKETDSNTENVEALPIEEHNENLNRIEALFTSFRKESRKSWKQINVKIDLYGKRLNRQANAVDNENEEAIEEDEEPDVGDGKVQVNGVRLEFSEYIAATMKRNIGKRINELIKARWSLEERLTLCVGKRDGNNLTQVPEEEIDALRGVLIVIQRKNPILNGDEDWLDENFRQRLMKRLKDERYYIKQRTAVKQKVGSDENGETVEGANKTQKKRRTAINTPTISDCDACDSCEM